MLCLLQVCIAQYFMKNCHIFFLFLLIYFPLIWGINPAPTSGINPNPFSEINPDTSSEIETVPSSTINLTPSPGDLATPPKVEQKENWGIDQETFGVPIPVVGASPNSGTTYGVLFAIVSETEGHIDSILAPVALYNPLTGYNIDVNYLGFPSTDITYQLYFSHTTENFWEYSGEVHIKNLWNESWSLDADFEFSREATQRFFGIGAETTAEDETCYTARNVKGFVTLRWEAMSHFYLTASLKGHHRWIRKGIIEDVPSIEQKFGTITGINGSYALPLELAAIVDTRDDTASPTSGFYGKMFVEMAREEVLSSYNFYRFGGEFKLFIPWDNDARFITAIHGLIEYMDGDNIPFYELSTLGGGKTLRGFGEGRFYDKHRVLMTVEQRVRLARFFAGEILLDLEGALFVDIGQVTDSFSNIKLSNMQTVFGAGIRFVVRSQIVAKVDIGMGEDGSAVFAGLHYPF